MGFLSSIASFLADPIVTGKQIDFVLDKLVFFIFLFI